MNYFLSKQNAYSLPLDSRRTDTRFEWILQGATLAEKHAELKAVGEPVYQFAVETPARIPLSDWHETTNGRLAGFQERSEVGGYFTKLLDAKNLVRWIIMMPASGSKLANNRVTRITT
jgi:hypothetical protein